MNNNLALLQQFGQKLLTQLREDFKFMTENLMKKSMQHANKQLQDTLMNYYLENYVSSILKKPLLKTTNRSVRESLEENVDPALPKYMGLIRNFEDKIEELGLSETYEGMLTRLIYEEKEFQAENADNWKTHVRKRMLSLMLYVHLKLHEKRDKLITFFELWKVVYPLNPLPQRVPRQGTHNKQKPVVSEQPTVPAIDVQDNALSSDKQEDTAATTPQGTTKTTLKRKPCYILVNKPTDEKENPVSKPPPKNKKRCIESTAASAQASLPHESSQQQQKKQQQQQQLQQQNQQFKLQQFYYPQQQQQIQPLPAQHLYPQPLLVDQAQQAPLYYGQPSPFVFQNSPQPYTPYLQPIIVISPFHQQGTFLQQAWVPMQTTPTIHNAITQQPQAPAQQMLWPYGVKQEQSSV